ncbi:hypothetical protein B0T17DRAFT_535427 [Bombardia bombarda]|uniref:Uncharacterized protein n=1 Tax=Bombardia bombarda TaxID=252184 RepID=A0AA40C2H2_9PEZI|nr:hypothetical protein B0T17DRAFT_535427 [Bombardia bombarda]
MRVSTKTDDLMTRVMEKLRVPIPAFILHRRLVVESDVSGDSDRHQLRVYGVGIDDTPVTFLQSVKLAYNRRVARTEPFTVTFRADLDEEAELQLTLELEFMGHYGEPNLEVVRDVVRKGSEKNEGIKTLYLLDYDPHTGEWKMSKQDWGVQDVSPVTRVTRSRG